MSKLQGEPPHPVPAGRHRSPAVRRISGIAVSPQQPPLHSAHSNQSLRHHYSSRPPESQVDAGTPRPFTGVPHVLGSQSVPAVSPRCARSPPNRPPQAPKHRHYPASRPTFHRLGGRPQRQRKGPPTPANPGPPPLGPQQASSAASRRRPARSPPWSMPGPNTPPALPHTSGHPLVSPTGGAYTLVAP